MAHLGHNEANADECCGQLQHREEGNGGGETSEVSGSLRRGIMTCYLCRVIHVYSMKHAYKKNGTIGKLGDRVLVAILGQKKKGIIVGMKQKQRHAVPRYDTNNIVIIEENGNPSGNRITAPLPNIIRPILQKDSNPKKADYTKLFAIASRWI